MLLASLRDEARLNARGEGYIYPRIVTALSQRLQVEDWYRRHPEIDDVEILPPLIGLGLPRTGSTALSLLLSQDPGIRYLRRWESSQPCPPPSTVQGPDPRIPEDEGNKVGSRAHVPTGTHAPMECLELMALDFKSHIFQAFAQIPSYSAWLVEKADLHIDLRLSAAGDEAAVLGGADAAVAAEVAVACVVARRSQSGLSRTLVS